jgi:hypothetical protein
LLEIKEDTVTAFLTPVKDTQPLPIWSYNFDDIHLIKGKKYEISFPLNAMLLEYLVQAKVFLSKFHLFLFNLHHQIWYLGQLSEELGISLLVLAQLRLNLSVLLNLNADLGNRLFIRCFQITLLCLWLRKRCF